MEEIIKFKLPAQFVSAAGNLIELVGTVSLEPQHGSNGYCTCGYQYRCCGVCVRCYVLNTVDMIKVNGKLVDGGYRRGTVLKMAGLKNPELNRICTNDNKLQIQLHL